MPVTYQRYQQDRKVRKRCNAVNGKPMPVTATGIPVLVMPTWRCNAVNGKPMPVTQGKGTLIKSVATLQCRERQAYACNTELIFKDDPGYPRGCNAVNGKPMPVTLLNWWKSVIPP